MQRIHSKVFFHVFRRILLPVSFLKKFYLCRTRLLTKCKLWFSGFWHYMVLQVVTSILEECTTSIFRLWNLRFSQCSKCHILSLCLLILRSVNVCTLLIWIFHDRTVPSCVNEVVRETHCLWFWCKYYDYKYQSRPSFLICIQPNHISLLN
jgi:hypothetical protein